jgi:YebC/PmpR family DNA-binding regulatory protein
MGRMFENRKHTMFSRWSRMAKLFTRLSKDVTIAVKAGGPNPDGNPTLRRALQNCRAGNMPKDKIQNAIDKAMGVGGADYQELTYEGFGPHGIALVIACATDNPVRTVANLRSYFNRHNGSLGTSGSVSFMFDHMGVFRINPGDWDLEELELELIDDGLEDMGQAEDEEGNVITVVRCAFNDFGNLQNGLETRKIEIVSSESEHVPQNDVELGDEESEAVLKLIDKVEQDEDVQKVFHNLG